MRSNNYSNSFARPFGLALSISAWVASACGQVGTIKPTIIEGRQFAREVKLPARFRSARDANGQLPVLFDHYTFRHSKVSPGRLLVAGCKNVRGSEICSDNSFAIDTDHGYAVREAPSVEWTGGLAVESEKELDDPVRHALQQELAKPVFLRATPIGRQGYEYLGYKYRGKDYLRRGDWIVDLNFAGSEDGRLVVLAGVDKRGFSKQDPSSVSSEVFTSLSGLVTIDVFDSDPSRHVAAVDLECRTNVKMARRRISLVNSRWLAIGLDPFLTDMLLLDFQPIGEQNK